MVTPILKSRNPANITNYQPIFVFAFLGKIFESIVLYVLKGHFCEIFSPQCGFFPRLWIVISVVELSSYLHALFNLNTKLTSYILTSQKDSTLLTTGHYFFFYNNLKLRTTLILVKALLIYLIIGSSLISSVSPSNYLKFLLVFLKVAP